MCKCIFLIVTVALSGCYSTPKTDRQPAQEVVSGSYDQSVESQSASHAENGNTSLYGDMCMTKYFTCPTLNMYGQRMSEPLGSDCNCGESDPGVVVP